MQNSLLMSCLSFSDDAEGKTVELLPTVIV